MSVQPSIRVGAAACLVGVAACTSRVAPTEPDGRPIVVATGERSREQREDAAGHGAEPPPPNGPAATTEPGAQISEYVRKVFRDRDGRFWFGTNDQGVGRFDGTELAFVGPEEGLAGRAVRGIVQDQAGAVWIATDGGVSRFRQGEWTTFRLGDRPSDHDAWSLLLDRAGTIWVGTLAGVRRLDGEAFAPFALPEAKAPIGRSLVGPGVVLDMHQDQAGNIWFGTDGAGLYRYDGTAFVNYSTADGLASNQILCVHADRRGRIWVGTDGGGVTRIDGPAMRTWTSMDGVGNDRVWDVMEDREGALWFATLGAGVTRFDGRSFTVYGAERGLTAGHVQNVFEDRDGTLWLGCSGGLFRREGDRFVNVTRDGPWSVGPLAAFSWLIGGRWKMTTTAGRDTFDTWSWGPGRQSIRSMRAGTLTDGDPWRAMTVYYWHPTLKEVRLLSVGSVWRGVGEGRTTFEGNSVESVLTLSQTGGPRRLRERWTRAGPDTYHDDLSEMVRDDYELLTGWDRVRVEAAKPAEQVSGPLAAPGSTPSAFMRPLQAVLGPVWASVAAPSPDATWTADEPRTRTTFEYVPHADAIYGRVEIIHADGAPSHAADIYLYHHTGSRTLRCLALRDDERHGTVVDEGDIVPAADGGSFVIRLTEHRVSGQESLEARIEFDEGGAARVRVWRPQGRERTMIMDRRHLRVRE